MGGITNNYFVLVKICSNQITDIVMTVANGHTDSIDTGACLTQVLGEE